MLDPFLHKIVKYKAAYTFIVGSAGVLCGFITLLFFFNLQSITFATFAAMAMQGILANENSNVAFHQQDSEAVSMMAIAHADGLLKALETK